MIRQMAFTFKTKWWHLGSHRFYYAVQKSNTRKNCFIMPFNVQIDSQERIANLQGKAIIEGTGGQLNSPVPLNLSSSPKRANPIQQLFFSNPNSALRERRQETALLIFADQAT